MDSSLGIELAEQQPQHHHHHHIHLQSQTQPHPTQAQQHPPLTLPAQPNQDPATHQTGQTNHQPNHVQNLPQSNQNQQRPFHQTPQANHRLQSQPQPSPSQPRQKLQMNNVQLSQNHESPHHNHQPTVAIRIEEGKNSNQFQAKNTSITSPTKAKPTIEQLENFFVEGLYNSYEATEELIKSIEDSTDEVLAKKLLHLYQQRYSTLVKPWEDVTFMYGLGMIYMHFNAYNWAARSFRDVIYAQPSFPRARDIHTRLGLIFKATGRYRSSEKHFNLAIHDTRKDSGTSSRFELEFQLAHLHEVQGKHKQAIDKYEKLLQEKDLPSKLSANINRQLGWIHYNSIDCHHDQTDLSVNGTDGLNDHRRIEAALRYLSASNNTETNSETSYYLGRCLTNIGKFQDAFASYRGVIDKEESTADTWCSIGVLYQRQNQPWDALQAYIRAVQYDKKHAIAWMNLGVLYENHNQFTDALKCYMHVTRITTNDIDKSLLARINYIQRHIKEIEQTSSNNGPKRDTDKLLSLEDLWNLESRNNQDNDNQPSTSSNSTDQSSTILVKEIPDMRLRVDSAKNLDDSNSDPSIWRDSSTMAMEVDEKQLSNGQNSNSNEQQISNSAKISANSYSINNNNVNCKSSIKKIEASTSNSDSKHIVPQSVEATLLINGLKLELEEPIDQDQTSNHIVAHAEQQKPIQLLIHSKEFTFSQAITNGASKDSGISSDSSTYADCALVPSQSSDSNPAVYTTAEQIIDVCKNDAQQKALKLDINLLSDEFKPPSLFPQFPPYPPTPSAKLFPSPPSIFLESKKELTLKRLQDLSQSHPISIVRNIATVLKLDLGLFSTRTLVESNPDQTIDITSHLSNPTSRSRDESSSIANIDDDINSVWTCERLRSTSTISRYAAYQATSFRDSLQSERESKSKINLTKESETDSNESSATLAASRKGGNTLMNISPITNEQRQGPNQKKIKTKDSLSGDKKYVRSADFIDLSDEKFWRPQLNELNKLPHFIRCISASNMLTHIGTAVPGVNTITMSMHVPGCRIIGNRAPNNFCPVIINTGPGDYDWCAVSGRYAKILSKLCNRNGYEMDSSQWWPRLCELQRYNVPIYRFSQRPGDLVWVSSGTFYWIHSTGWTNCIQWNIGPLCAQQYRLSSDSFEVNKLLFKKSLVPMVQLTWNIVININVIFDDDLFNLIADVLRRSLQYCAKVRSFIQQTNEGKKIKTIDHEPGPRQPKYCTLCECEIFNISFKRKHRDELHCVECARRVDSSLNEYKIYQEYNLKYLMELYDNFISFKQKLRDRQSHIKLQQQSQLS